MAGSDCRYCSARAVSLRTHCRAKAHFRFRCGSDVAGGVSLAGAVDWDAVTVAPFSDYKSDGE